MFSGFGYDADEGRVDRTCWAEKSEAAIQRENQAKRRLDDWIQTCSQLQQHNFPVSLPDLVPAGIHLTKPCWLSFRKYATSKGVQVCRREATPQERADSGDKRKGKLYVVWSKLPVHPIKAVMHAEFKKKEAEAASRKRKERQHEREEERKRAEEVKRQKVMSAYQHIVQQLPSVSEAVGRAEIASDNPEPTPSNAAFGSPPPNPQLLAPAGRPESPPLPQDILKYADEAYQKELREINTAFVQEMKTVETELKQKKKALEAEALQLCKQVKASVLSSLSPEKQCSKCQKQCKLLVAECLGCNAQICAECLVDKVNSEHRCYLCKETWLGKKPSPNDLSSIQQDAKHGLAKFVCLNCPSRLLEYAICTITVAFAPVADAFAFAVVSIAAVGVDENFAVLALGKKGACARIGVQEDQIGFEIA